MLGLFNTVIACVFGKVLAKVVDTDTKKTIRWYWDQAEKWPQAQE